MNSPTKGLKGEQESYLASVKFKVNISKGFRSSQAATQGKALLKPGNGDTFDEVDIFKKQDSNDFRFYIFDPGHYKPSNDLNVLKEARQKLQSDLRFASGKTGCYFLASNLKSWGPSKNAKNFKWFQFCCTKSKMMNKTSRGSTSIDVANHYQDVVYSASKHGHPILL